LRGSVTASRYARRRGTAQSAPLGVVPRLEGGHFADVRIPNRDVLLGARLSDAHHAAVSPSRGRGGRRLEVEVDGGRW
jgi:hypothetical protein